MPSKSIAQQRLMGQAYSLKKGDLNIEDIDPLYRDEIERLSKDMTVDTLKKFASTKHKDLPAKVNQTNEDSLISHADVNGIGNVILPGEPASLDGFSNQSTGSGDSFPHTFLKNKKTKLIKTFEEFLYEAFIEDPDITTQISAFYDLQEQIKILEAELSKKKKEFKQFETDVKPMIDGMKDVGDKLAETEEYVIKVSKFGGDRLDVSYKNAFESALEKVNAATKRVLNEALEASKKVTHVKHSFSIDKIVTEASLFDKIKGAIKGAINKLLNIFKKESKNIDDANKDLKKLTQK